MPRPKKKQAREKVNATYLYDSGEQSSAAAVGADRHDDDNSDDEDDDMDDLPVEGGSVFDQLGAILEGSSDEEMVEVLAQVPALNDGTKIIVGMQKLSNASSAFLLLQPIAAACENEGVTVLFNKIGALSQAQVEADIATVFADDAETLRNLMSHPPEQRRRLFFTSLAAGYLSDDE